MNHYVLQWRSPAMDGMAFWYYTDVEEAVRDAQAMRDAVVRAVYAHEPDGTRRLVWSPA